MYFDLEISMLCTFYVKNPKQLRKLQVKSSTKADDVISDRCTTISCAVLKRTPRVLSAPMFQMIHRYVNIPMCL